MDRKQSQFTAVSTLSDADYIPAFGQSTNIKILKSDLFEQIRTETQIFIYPTIELLQAADLIADPDWPVYVRIEETGYRLYKITSLSANDGDVELDNGTVATLQNESLTRYVNYIGELVLSSAQNGISIKVTGYHQNSEVGGGEYIYDSSHPKTLHNGGTVIDPDIVFPADWNNTTQVTAWYTPAVSGTGCWIYAGDDVDAKNFGASEQVGFDSARSINAFIAALPTIKNKNLSWTGELGISIPVLFNSYFDDGVTINCSCKLTATAAMDMMLNLVRCETVVFAGMLTLDGANLAKDGIYTTRSRAAEVANTYGVNLKRWHINMSNDPVESNNNFLKFGVIRSVLCGTTTTVTFTKLSDSGAINSRTQNSIITVSSVPANFEVNFWGVVVATGQPVYVTAIAGNDLTIYPQIADASGSIKLCVGGAVRQIGANAGRMVIDEINMQFCAHGFYAGGQYGGAVQQLTAQIVTIGTIIGQGIANVHAGTCIDNVYYEACDVNVVTFEQSYCEIKAPIFDHFTLTKLWNLLPRSPGSNTLSERLALEVSGRWITKREERTGSTNDIFPSHDYFSQTASTSASRTFNIVADESSLRYAATPTITLELYNFLTGTITIGASVVGETIEGGATFAINNPGRFLTLVFNRIGVDWKIQYIQSEAVTSIAEAPAFAGQKAVSGGNMYLAVGVASSADWKIAT